MKFLFPRCAGLILATLVLETTIAIHAAPPIELLSDLAEWKDVTPFKPAAMTFERTTGGTPPLRLKIKSGGDRRDVGGWVRALPRMEKARRYRLEAAFTVEGIEAPQRHVFGLLTGNGRE